MKKTAPQSDYAILTFKEQIKAFWFDAKARSRMVGHHYLHDPKYMPLPANGSPGKQPTISS